MIHSDDLDQKSAAILEALNVNESEVYWRAVHAVSALVAEVVALRGFKNGTLAYLRGPIDGVIEEACVVAADNLERGEHLEGRNDACVDDE